MIGSTYWKATWPFANSSRAISSLTTNLPSPWLTGMVCSSPMDIPRSQGEFVVATLVVTICETCRLMSLRNRVGECLSTFPPVPYGSSPDLTRAWNPLHIPRISPSRATSLSMADLISSLFRTLAMNLPLPSGSSPAENPPESIRIWQLSMFSRISAMESKTSWSVRFLNTVVLTSAPAFLNALAVS